MKIFIAPRYTHKSILSYYRNEDPFAEIKFFTKKDLEKMVFPQVGDVAVIYLMNSKNYTFEFARTILSFIPYCKTACGTEKLDLVASIYKDLEQHGLISNEYTGSFLENNDVHIFGYSDNDNELKFLIKKLSLKPTFVKLNNQEIKCSINTYNNLEQEVFAVLNKIASLIDKGISTKDIFILNRNSEYEYYLKKYCSTYGFQLNIKTSESWFSTGAYAHFIKIYKENKDIELSLSLLKEMMKEDDLFSDFEQLVKQCIHTEFDYYKQLDYLEGVLKNTSLKQPIYTNSIEVISNPIMCENKHIFVLGFTQGQYPKVSKDNGYLNDNELLSINRLTSLDKINNDLELLKQLFTSNNNLYFSYSKHSSSSQYYPSPFKNIFDMQEIQNNLDDEYYSKTALSHIFASLKDLEYFYHEKGKDFYKVKGTIDIPYNTYDNSVKETIPCYDYNSVLKLSTTGLDKYSNCPYSYYLNRILKLDDETAFNADLGTIAHAIMESINSKNFDFDVKFDEEINKKQFKNSELFVLKNFAYDQLKEAVDSVILRNLHTLNPTFVTERNFSYQIDPKTYVVGRVDLTEVIDNDIVICIDYKTSYKQFDETKLQYGLSTQLPTYMLLYMNDEIYKNYRLGGIYINQIMSSKYKETIQDGNLIKDYLKLNGKTLNDFGTVFKIDMTIIDGKCMFISSIKTKDKCSLSESKSLISQNEFAQYRDIALHLYRKMSVNLRNNSFTISPLFFNKDDNACKWCSYRDICYLREKQIRKIVKEEKDDE